MSANCDYSIKFYPLVQQWINDVKLGKLSQVEFTQLMQKTFKNGKSVAENLLRGIIIAPNGDPVPPKKNVTGRGKPFTEDVALGINSFYADNTSRRLMERKFKKAIVGASIVKINFEKNTWEPVDISKDNLGKNIAQYKIELLNIIEKSLNLKKTEYSKNLNGDDLFDLIVDRCKTIKEKNLTSDFIEDNVWDAYAILLNFDKLVEKLTPYIIIKEGYKNSNNIDKYKYVGPKSNMFTNYTSGKNADFADAETQVSDLSKILLDVFPECSLDDGKLTILENTGIGLSGFNAVMTTLKNSITSGQLLKSAIEFFENDKDAIEIVKSHINSFYKAGLNVDLDGLIDDYITVIGNQENEKSQVNKQHKTYMLNKLRGIQTFICSDETPIDIKNMFYAMFRKTEHVGYRGYMKNRDGIFTGKNLSDSLVDSQVYFLQDVVNGAIAKITNSDNTAINLKNTYNLKFLNDGNDRSGKITLGKGDNTVIINYEWKGAGNFKCSLQPGYDESLLQSAFLDILSFIIPSDYETCIPGNISADEHFTQLLSVVLLKCNKRLGGDIRIPGFNVSSRSSQLILSEIQNLKTEIAPRLGVIYGSETRNVVKDPAGNKLPNYQLTCLNYNVHSLLYDYEHNNEGHKILDDNLIVQHPELLKGSWIRNDVAINGQIKGVEKLKTKELLRLAIINDFAEPLKSGSIFLQNATFADKGTHFLQEYNLNTKIDWKKKDGTFAEVSLKELITDIAEAESYNDMVKACESLSELIRITRAAKMEQLVNNIVTDYEKVFGDEIYKGKVVTDFSSKLQAIDDFLKTKTEKEITLAFRNTPNVDLYEEIHYYKPKNNSLGEVRFNETILNLYSIYKSPKLWKERLTFNRSEFLNTLKNEEIRLNKHIDKDVDFSSVSFTGFHPSLHNSITGDTYLSDGVNALPIVEAYFLADVLLSNEFNSLTIGETFAHPNKNKNGENKEYYQFSENNRWVAQIKRSVIFGGTVHPFQHNVYFDDGYNHATAEEIDIAIMRDIPAAVWNYIGDVDTVDSMDGSGLQLAIQSRLENNSLIDARVGSTNKKTLMHSIDYKYGRPSLLKWAVYTLTNELRRNSYKSKVSGENLVKRMMSKTFDNIIDFDEEYQEYVKQYGPIVFEDFKTGNYYRIDNLIKNQDDYWSRTLTRLDENGNVKETLVEETKFKLNTLYAVDQIFGGAWAGKFNGQFEFTDGNNDMLENIICKYGLKDKFIAYIVNKSAIKVGAGNVNEPNSWWDNSELQTIKMSTKYGGVQMDADHNLDESDVTEMTQMISSLIEGGHYSELVWSVYQDIGQILAEKLKGFISDVEDIEANSNKRTDLYARLAASFVAAYNSGSRDTIGLAQAFVKKASTALKNGDYSFKLPFSAATISGAFIADVASTINKKGIRRKFEGFAGVLNPSYNMIQFYRVRLPGATIDTDMLFNEFAKYVTKAGWNIDLLDKYQDEFGNINPFAVRVNALNEINIEDTIYIKDIDKYITIDSFYNYDKYINRSNYQEVYKITSAPRNLAQGDTKFKINGITFSLLNLDTVRAAYYLSKAGAKELAKAGEDIESLQNWARELARSIDPGNEDYLTVLNKETQRITKTFDTADKQYLEMSQGSRKSLSDRAKFKPGSFVVSVLNAKREEGTPIIENVLMAIDEENGHWMAPHEIITGKYQWNKLDIRKGDTIHKIKSLGKEYFKNVLKEKIKFPEIVSDEDSKLLYDVVLYKGETPILVKFGEVNNKFSYETNPKFVINDRAPKDEDNVTYEEQLLCNSENKQFWLYRDDSGQEFDLIVIDNQDDFNDLLDSNLFNDLYRLNFREDNKSYLQVVAAEENKNVDISQDLAKLIDWERTEFEKDIDKIAEERWNAFQQLGYYVGARIPTQEMASYMPMKVVAVTDCPDNQIYVPRSQTWLQGSDYDIDKLYVLVHSLNDNGKLTTGSKLERDLPLNIIRKLGKPNGIKYSIGKDGYILSKKTAERLGKVTKYSNRTEQAFLAKTFKDIYDSEKRNITFLPGVKIETQTKIINILNKHSLTKSKRYNNVDAIKNRIVDKILDITRSSQNQIMSFNPINMDEPRAVADASTLGAAEKQLTTDNPAAKFIMQEQNMIGREVIGIVAVSLKTYFALLTYYNNILDNAIKYAKDGNVNKLVTAVSNLMIYNPIDNHYTAISGLDITRLIEEIDESGKIDLSIIRFNDKYNLRQVLEFLEKEVNKIDTPKILSSLLSAATDNAKELILAKINATPELVDIYTYCAMLGKSLTETAQFMSSPELTEIVKILSDNVFDPSTNGIGVKEDSDFILGEKLPKGLNRDILEGFLLRQEFDKYLIKGDVVERQDAPRSLKQEAILRLLNDNAIIDKLLEIVDTSFNIKSSKYDPDYYDNFDEESTLYLKTSFSELTYKERFIFKRLLELCKKRNNLLVKGEDKLKQFTSAIEGTKEMSVLGRTLGVNQGLKTKTYEQYSFIKNIENHVQRKINDRYKEINKKIKNKSEKITPPKFNFINFILGNDREFWYTEYPEVTFDILRTLTSVPHFAKMAQMMGFLDKALNELSYRYNVTMKLANDICEYGKSVNGTPLMKLNRNEFRELERYVNERLIYDYLIGSDLKLVLPKGQTYYKGPLSTDLTTIHNDYETISLNDLAGLATFKHTMEDYIIPELKKKYPKETFLKYLTYAEEPPTFRGEIKTYYKLPLAMDSVEKSVNTEEIYTNCLASFNSIAKDRFMGWEIGDLFYLYNMLVNKDSFGKYSLTRIFEDLIAGGKTTSLIENFNGWLALLDYNPKSIGDLNEWVNEAIYRICKYVPETKMKNISGYSGNITSSDFPLDLPFSGRLTKLSNKIDQTNKFINHKLGGQEIMYALKDNIDVRFGKDEEIVHLITDEDFDGATYPDLANDNVQKAKDVPAFIYNGEIYVNLSHAQDRLELPLHELAHFVLASWKMGENKELYYKLLKVIKTHPMYDTFSKPYIDRYGNLGSDVDEEVLCKLIESYLANKLIDFDPRFKNAILVSIKEMLNGEDDIKKIDMLLSKTTSAEDIVTLLSNRILLDYDKSFNKNSIILNEKMRSIKTYWVNNNQLDYDCDEPF